MKRGADAHTRLSSVLGDPTTVLLEIRHADTVCAALSNKHSTYVHDLRVGEKSGFQFFSIITVLPPYEIGRRRRLCTRFVRFRTG